VGRHRRRSSTADRRRQPDRHPPFVSKLIPRGPDNPEAPNAAHPTGSEIGVQPMYGHALWRRIATIPIALGIPCKQPSWVFMAGVDLKTMTIVWMHRIRYDSR
jgi:quinoprotein glucose dehydrogenase